MSKKNVEEEVEYGVESITTLPPIEAIRARPHMYIGKIDTAGLHHLIRELVDNSIDEALVGYCNRITVKLLGGDDEGTAEVTDNGRGIPCGINSKGVEVLEEMFTTTHSGGKFNNKAYKISGGLHGVGTTIVNALSDFCYITSKRDGMERELKFENAKSQGLKDIGKTKETGTTVRFKPSASVFEECTFEYNLIKDYLTEKAYLNPGVTFVLHDMRTNDYDEIKKNGLGDLLDDMTQGHKMLNEDMCEVKFSGEDGFDMEVYVKFMNSSETMVKSFANSIPTVQGGSHLDAVNKALCEVINTIGIKMGIINKNEPLKVPDIKDGLGLIVSVKFSKIAYESQTKDKLSVPEVYKNVLTVLSDDPLKAFKKIGNAASLEKIGTLASELCMLSNLKEIIQRFVDIRDRKEHVKSAKSAGANSKSLRLNPNIKEASSKNPWEKEVFIVEGESAGGTAGSARNLYTQAIVRLRGKIQNVSKANIKDVYSSPSLVNMITAIGTGCGPDFDIDKLKYHKIIILTDADIDGAHIRALIINFFFRFMPQLLYRGHVYIAASPLFGIKDTRTGKTYYAYSTSELNEVIETHLKDRTYNVTRFKGLGEMNADQLRDTSMNPASRRLIQLVVDESMTEEDMKSKMDEIFAKDVEFRKTMMEDVIEERRELARQQ